MNAENEARKIKRGVEEAERISLWHVRHVPYSVDKTLPAPEPSKEEQENEIY